ncbi:hypothetical protein G9A89_003345 [Geosiphon pyriformis]|nr:hypothetical protein G9A89_003345 [Geosiphon pyriformis]
MPLGVILIRLPNLYTHTNPSPNQRIPPNRDTSTNANLANARPNPRSRKNISQTPKIRVRYQNIMGGNNFSVLKNISTCTPIFAVSLVIKDTLEKNLEIYKRTKIVDIKMQFFVKPPNEHVESPTNNSDNFIAGDDYVEGKYLMEECLAKSL